jgi:diguanylate cyclase (GGDEF)-like protein
MTLRKKTLLIVGATLLILIIMLSVMSRIIILRSFLKLEEKYVFQNIHRTQAFINENLTNLNSKARDWATWNNTYEFIKNKNDKYIKVNLVDSTFSTLRINLIMLMDASGNIVLSKAYDLNSNKAVPVPNGFLSSLSDKEFPLQRNNLNKNITGIVLLPDGPLFIAGWPILKSEEEGPASGMLFFGRNFDTDYLRKLADVSDMAFDMSRFNDPALPDDFKNARDSLSAESPVFVKLLSKSRIAGYTTINDVYGKPDLILRITMQRDIYNQGLNNFYYFVLSLTVVGLVLGIVTFFLLEEQVLSRLTRLSSDVKSIGASGNPSMRVLVKGKDELSLLKDEINGMLEALESSEKELRKSKEALLALSLRDELTGLYNRRGFLTLAEQQLKLANRAKKGLLMIFVDVDGMKDINDTLGHRQGDSVLVDTARILGKTFRESDIIARYGGDEFIILSIENTESGAELFETRLREHLEYHNNYESRLYTLSLSTGFARYDPDNPLSIEDLLVEADHIMYDKKNGKKR